MKTNLLITGLSIVLILGSCAPGRYLPKVDEIDVNIHGSRINVNRTLGPMSKGELIAIDSSQLVVLVDSSYTRRIIKRTMIIPIKEIKSFRLIYAKPFIHWVTIPIFALTTGSHGAYFIFSAPVNLLVTILASRGAAVFQYNDKQMTYEKLKMFARFPQGIPPDINIASIK